MKGNSSARAREKASERRQGGRQNRDEEREREALCICTTKKDCLILSLLPLPSFLSPLLPCLSLLPSPPASPQLAGSRDWAHRSHPLAAAVFVTALYCSKV